jgi:hypothetical protein
MTDPNQPLEATFSTLAMSIASSAIMSLGLVPNPATNKVEKNIDMARFNIDLLKLLKDKTKGNLETEESQFLDSIIGDLQLKFVEASK